jgi:hypothetical protein
MNHVNGALASPTGHGPIISTGRLAGIQKITQFQQRVTLRHVRDLPYAGCRHGAQHRPPRPGLITLK